MDSTDDSSATARGTVLDPAAEEPSEDPWLTAIVRPVGMLRRRDADRLHGVLDPLSAHASVVVLDLDAAQLAGPGAAAVIDVAASHLEERGGCLLCVNADAHDRAHLEQAGAHTVVADGLPVRAESPTTEIHDRPVDRPRL